MSIRINLAHAVALALILGPGTTLAATINYTLYAGIEHSDNINLTNTNPTSANVLTPGVAFNFVQQGAVIQAQAAGNLAYRHYLGNNLTDQTQTQLSGQMNWAIAPQRLDFALEDYAAIQPVDNLASDSPANQQQTNVLLFGPTLHFGLGTALRGQAELRYINSHAEKTKGFNSRRSQAALRIIRDLSPTDQLSLNGQFQHTDFYRADSGPNYNRSEVFADYISHLARVDLDVAAGWSKLNFHDSQSRTRSDPLLRAALAWRVTERSTLTAAGSRQYSDAATAMQEQQAGQLAAGNAGIGGPGGHDFGGGTNAGNAAANSQIYVQRTASLSYGFRTERLSLEVTPAYRKLDYVNNAQFNQTGRSGSVNVQYQLQPTLTLSASVYGEKLTYQALNRRDQSFNYRIALARQMTPHWSWNGSFQHRNRNSSVPMQGFHENQIYFGIAFRR